MNNIECDYNEYENIKPFLLFYNSECGSKFYSEEKLLNMLNYFKITKETNAANIVDYGKFFRENRQTFVDLEKKRQRYYNNSDKLLPNYIENPNYLIATYNRLKRCITNKNQHIILKDSIICLSPIDVEYFINMLLRKYKTQQIQQIISKIEKSN
ncbi:MAG: hypothetical protein EOL97_10075 [Spirochaetia bacterium]|nr:hypothetical protein [Spirochaetia bacterium]